MYIKFWVSEEKITIVMRAHINNGEKYNTLKGGMQ